MAFVYTSDLARGRAFYRHTLGLRLVEEEIPYALVFDMHGIMQFPGGARVAWFQEPDSKILSVTQL